MTSFVTRRIALMLVSIWGLATIVFFLIKLIPGDEARAAAGQYATPEQVQVVSDRLGLGRSIFTQYGLYLRRLLHGDLGTSTVSLQPVTTDLANALPSTLELVVAAMIVNLLLGVPVGILAATFRDRLPDALGRALALIAGGLPLFWLAYMVQWLVGAKLKWLPVSGQLSVQYTVPARTHAVTVDALLARNFPAVGDALEHLVLPAVVLAAPFCAVIIRTVRASFITVLVEDHIVVARAKGASTGRIVLRHALRSASIPSVTIVGLQIGWMVGGTVLIESIFNRQGIGSYLVNAVEQKDSLAVLGTVLFIGVIVILASFVVDLAQLGLDPRIRRAELTAA